VTSVATVSIRDLDDNVRDRLRIRAARNGRSMEAEMRAILTAAVAEEQPEYPDAVTMILDVFRGFDDVVLEIEPRTDDDHRPIPFADLAELPE
jgi:plasmid stability protein